MIFTSLLLSPLLVLAQATRPAAPSVPAAAPVQVEPTVTSPANAPAQPTATVPGAPASPVAPLPGAAGPITSSPPPSGTSKEPVSWSTAVLQEAVAKSIGEAKSPKPKKGKKLSEKQVGELRAKIARKPKDMKSRMKLAEHFETVAQPNEVIEILHPSSEDLNREGLLTLARAYRAKEDHLQEARVLQQQAIETPSDYVVHTLLGEAFVSMKNFDKGIDSFSEAKRLNNKYLPAYEALLRESLKNGQRSDAMSTAQEMIENFGETSKITSQLCLLYAEQAFLDKAIETCKLAIAKYPKKPDNHVFLGLAIREKDGDGNAAKIIQKAAKQFPKSELAQYVAGEFFYSSMKNGTLATKYFKQAVKNDINSARANLGLAKASFDEKNYDESLEAFVRACKLNRTFISDFRKSTGLLRRDGKKVMLVTRFERGMSECGYR